jgi:hypothetical protein
MKLGVSWWYTKSKASEKAVDEATIGIRNELGHVQWELLLAQQFTACMVGILNMCCINLET